jgi:putative FmdB family regulatory protein
MPTYTFMCERCKKSFEMVLPVAERAAAKVACPTCGGGEITPQMAIFTAKTSRKSCSGSRLHRRAAAGLRTLKKDNVVAPTGFDRQASLFELVFEGFAFAA